MVRLSGLLPAPIAGLSLCKAWVRVVAPLSAKGASLGSMGFAAVPTISPLTPLVKPVA